MKPELKLTGKKEIKLNDSFGIDDDGIEQVAFVVKEEEFDFHDEHTDDVSDDYRFMRKKLRKTVALSEAILDQTLTYVPNDARTIEACTNTIKNMVSAIKELQEMHVRHKNLNKKQDEKPSLIDDKTIPKMTLNELITKINSEGAGDENGNADVEF